MNRRCLLLLVASVLTPAALLAGQPAGATCGVESAAAPGVTTRTLYVTVTDNKGAAVPDLTAADFQVKEGGKAREVSKASPATAKMRISVMVDERFVGDGPTRFGIFEFMKRLQPAAEFALLTVGLRNQIVLDYTSDLNAVVAAINAFTLNPGPVSNFSEGLLEFTKKLKNAPGERPIIVAVALPGGGEVGGVMVSETLNSLRMSGAVLSAVSLGSGGGAGEQIIDDGVRQSGGRRIHVSITTTIPDALQQIANDLSSQYAVTYTLPDGVKPDRKVSVSVTRKGLRLRAPTAIPDR